MTGEKTGPLYDSVAFSSNASADDFQRNILKRNMIYVENTSVANRQFLVTYNNMAVAKSEEEPMCLTVTLVWYSELDLAHHDESEVPRHGSSLFSME